MGEEKMIQVSLQLPISELAGLTALAERLTALLATGSQTAVNQATVNQAVKEQAVATGFDEARFRELEETADSLNVSSPVPSAPGSEGEVELTDLSDTRTLQLPELGEISEVRSAESAVSEIPDAETGALPSFTDLTKAQSNRQAFRAEPVPGAAEAESDALAAVNQTLGGEIPYTEHGNSVVERLVAEGPAPLTAEAVSQAFCRDDRRYDNGFPLY